MAIQTLKDALPEYAKDLKLNLSSIVQEEILNEQQLWGCFLASALATRNPQIIREIAEDAAEHLSDAAQNGAKAAHAIMSMNNIYYKFVGMLEGSYQTMPAKLRMNIIASPGVDKLDFELWSLAVSVINGCKFCVGAHEKQVTSGGLSEQQVQTAVRIAAIVHAVSATLDGEQALGNNALANAA